MEFSGEPLDTAVISVKTKQGQEKDVKALNVAFMEPRNYVTYKLLPTLLLQHKDRVCHKNQINEWKLKIRHLIKDLLWLLNLPHQRFWCQTIYDEQLHLCLHYYLSQAPRDYNLNLEVGDDLLSIHRQLHRLMFLVLLRMATHKESKSTYITPRAFGNLIYDNYVFDIPRIMDFCALYGFSNSQIVARMVNNLFANQPKYLEDLKESIPVIFMSLQSVEEKAAIICCSKWDPEEQSLPMPSSEINNLVDYVADISATLHCFLETCEQVCSVYFKEGFQNHIPAFYDTIFDRFTNELLPKAKQEMNQSSFATLKQKLGLSKFCFVNAFRHLVNFCCIHPIIAGSYEKHEVETGDMIHSLFDYFVQLITDISKYPSFFNDYNQLFPILEDMHLLSDSGLKVDIVFFQELINSTTANMLEKLTFDNEDRIPFNPLSASKRLDADFNLQKNNVSRPKEPSPAYSCDLLATGGAKPADTVLEVFPDLAVDFLQACLKYYENDPEKVVNALITSSLPPMLEEMQSKSVSKQEPLKIQQNVLRRKNIFDNDEFDVFNREKDDIALDKMHRGKIGKTPNAYRDLEDDQDSKLLKDMILKFAIDAENEDVPSLDDPLLYDDEYDDTYDSQPVCAMETQPDPDVISPEDKLLDNSLQPEEEESNQDHFCVNPAILRKKAEEKRAAENKNVDYPRRGNRYSGNHHRRKLADFKRRAF